MPIHYHSIIDSLSLCTIDTLINTTSTSIVDQWSISCSTSNQYYTLINTTSNTFMGPAWRATGSSLQQSTSGRGPVPFSERRRVCPSRTRKGYRYHNNENIHRGIHAVTAGAQKSLGVLEKSGKVVPQGLLVKVAKFGWNLAWKIFMNELAPQSKDGMYIRPGYTFQQQRIGDEEFPAETPGLLHPRYVLFVGNPCPWCHRVLMAAELRGLVGTLIDVVYLVDDPERASRGGWVFDGVDPYFACSDLRQVYDTLCGIQGGFLGRCTAPLLVDTVSKRIVSNESSIIIEMFDDIDVQGVTSSIRLRPESLLADINAFNDRVFDQLNNGVYKCGFSTEQEAYTKAYTALCETLDELDDVLSRQRFLLGEKFTDVDLRVFATAARFDAVYSTLFKCIQRISDYPHLHRWFLECAQLPLPTSKGTLSPRRTLADTVDIDDCRRSYFSQLFPLNPGGIIPSGPLAKDILGNHSALSRENHDDDLHQERTNAIVDQHELTLYWER